MSAPTPSDVEVRGRYCDGVYVQTGHTTEGEDFDRWLAQHDARVAAETLRDAAVFPGSRLSYAAREWLRARADKLEGKA